MRAALLRWNRWPAEDPQQIVQARPGWNAGNPGAKRCSRSGTVTGFVLGGGEVAEIILVGLIVGNRVFKVLDGAIGLTNILEDAPQSIVEICGLG